MTNFSYVDKTLVQKYFSVRPSLVISAKDSLLIFVENGASNYSDADLSFSLKLMKTCDVSEIHKYSFMLTRRKGAKTLRSAICYYSKTENKQMFEQIKAFLGLFSFSVTEKTKYATQGKGLDRSTRLHVRKDVITKEDLSNFQKAKTSLIDKYGFIN